MFSFWKRWREIRELESFLNIGKECYEEIPGSWEGYKIRDSEYLDLLGKIYNFNFKDISYSGISRWNIKTIDLDKLFLEISESNNCRKIVLQQGIDVDFKVLSKCGTIFSIEFLCNLGYDVNSMNDKIHGLDYENYYINNYIKCISKI